MVSKKHEYIKKASAEEFEKFLADSSTGEVVDLSARFINLTDESAGGGPGAYVVGKLLSMEEQKFDNGSRNVYTMELHPSGEKIRLAGQTRLDQIIQGGDYLDQYLAIRYDGEERTRKGHRLGQWTVRQIEIKT